MAWTPTEAASAAALQALLALAAAPLLLGLHRALAAWPAGPRPALLSPYRELWALAAAPVRPGPAVGTPQRLAAGLALAALLAAAALVSPGGVAPAGAGAALLAYLLVLSAAGTLVGSVVVGGAPWRVGVRREVLATLALEPLLAMSALAGAVRAGTFALAPLLAGAAHGPRLPLSGLAMLVPVLASLLAFEVPPGPGPALLRYLQMVRLVVCASLAVALFLPRPAHLPFPEALALAWAETALAVAGVAAASALGGARRLRRLACEPLALAGWTLGALLLAGAGL